MPKLGQGCNFLTIYPGIDFYSFTIMQKGSASEGEMRFAIAALSSTVIGLLSYMVGRASK